jgi:murein DD-endopeptidase MepM/ murein hydrolase activator NlpD
VDRSRGVVSALAVMAVVTLVALPPGVSGADSHEDPERAVERATEELEHATEREREAAARYLEATEALPAAEERLAEARERVSRARTAWEEAAAEEETASAQVAAATRRHEQLRADVEDAQQRVDAIAVAAYKGGGMYAFSSVLASGSPGEVINRLGVLGQVSANEREALDELADAEQRAEAALQEASRAEEHATGAREQAQAALAAARAAEDEAKQAADEVEALIATRAEALEVARQEREKAEEEKARVEEELRAWEEANRDRTADLASGGTLLMPVDGVKTSDYGWRHHPVYDEPRLHTGVDFAAPAGTPIWAAADGVVMQAGWNGGYGYFTCLSHGSYEGQGLSTCYAHQSEIWVSVDQTVAAGDVIGLVGSTGTSTGDHLHFEVRLDGTPVDPLPFLPECLC